MACETGILGIRTWNQTTRYLVDRMAKDGQHYGMGRRLIDSSAAYCGGRPAHYDMESLERPYALPLFRMCYADSV